MKPVPQDRRLPAPAGAVVLDTHVVLEWLWFSDPRTLPLGHAIARGHRKWWVCPPMEQEWQRILARLARSAARSSTTTAAPTQDAELANAHFSRFAQYWPHMPPPAPYRCSDPDDQMFIDLGLATGARCLLTRDRALCKLRTRALAHGLLIGAPEDWCWKTDGP